MLKRIMYIGYNPLINWWIINEWLLQGYCTAYQQRSQVCHLTCNIEDTWFVASVPIKDNDALICVCVTEPQISQETLQSSFRGKLCITLQSSFVDLIYIRFSLKPSAVIVNATNQFHGPQVYMQVGTPVSVNGEKPGHCDITIFFCLIDILFYTHGEFILTCRSKKGNTQGIN